MIGCCCFSLTFNNSVFMHFSCLPWSLGHFGVDECISSFFSTNQVNDLVDPTFFTVSRIDLSF